MTSVEVQEALKIGPRAAVLYVLGSHKESPAGDAVRMHRGFVPTLRN